MLMRWEKLPKYMQNEKVKRYYDILKKKSFSLILKRIFDILASLFLIILLSPVMLFLAIWIKVDSDGPVFYRQERVTTYGKKFRIFKFRTMVTNADKIGSLVTVGGDSRITKVGQKLRHCRLDEIPQVLNIFIGEMSFVGTRPEVQKYVDAYTAEMCATLLMPAGVTSTASINFKDEDKMLENSTDVDTTYTKEILPLKMQYNLDYIKKFNFFEDIKICFKTVF